MSDQQVFQIGTGYILAVAVALVVLLLHLSDRRRAKRRASKLDASARRRNA